jgi:SAM-dependent methyltransferase
MAFYSQFAAYYEAVFPFREEVYAFLRSLLVPGGRRVLDAGCGTGHYCGRFAADGVEAVGIDLDPEMIQVARATYPRATFHCLNMLDVGTLRPPFDLSFCIGNSAPHLTQDEFGRVVAEATRLLHPGGLWVLQVMNWDFVLDRGGYPFRPRTLSGGEAVFLREYRDISESRLRFLTRLVSGERTVFEGDVWLYPLRSEAYLRLHAQHGLELVDHFADFSRTPYDPGSEAGSVFVFRKP